MLLGFKQNSWFQYGGLQESFAVHMFPDGWKIPYGHHAVSLFCLHGLLLVCTPTASIDRPGGDPWQCDRHYGSIWVCEVVRGVAGMPSLQLEQQH